MVRHIRTDNGHIFTLGHPAARVIQGFKVPVDSLPPASARRAKFSVEAEGSIIAASAVAYGAMTMSSLSPRLRPSPEPQNWNIDR